MKMIFSWRKEAQELKTSCDRKNVKTWIYRVAENRKTQIKYLKIVKLSTLVNVLC